MCGHIFKCKVTFLDRWSHCIKYAVQRHQDGVYIRRLFSFTGLKPTFILHINRHRKFRCLFFVCQREKRIDLTIENMV